MTVDIRLSNSKVKTFKRCEKQYEFKYVKKLKPKSRKVQLEVGDWLHQLLMVHYDEGDVKERFVNLRREFNNLFEEEREELGDVPNTVLRIMTAYLRHWKDEDAQHHTIDSELDEIITLPNGLRFQMIVDRIYEESDGGLWVQDHKSLKSFMDADFMMLDYQLTRYFWGLEHMGYTPLRGIEFNELRTKPPTVPAMTQQGRLSKARIETDYWTYLQAVKDNGLNPTDYVDMLDHLRDRGSEDYFRRTRLPRDSPMTDTAMKELVSTANKIIRAEKKGEFDRTPLKSCKWDCDFKEPCIIQLQGGNIGPILKARYVTNRRED